MFPRKISIEELRRIISEVNPAAEAWLGDAHVNLLEIGALDSFNITELITELEKRYGITILAADILVENFHSIQALLDLLVSRYGFEPIS